MGSRTVAILPGAEVNTIASVGKPPVPRAIGRAAAQNWDMDDRSGVAVVGSINADLAAFGSPLPRPGETVIGTDFSLVLGGKGANQAIAAVRAGAPTYMIGAVGDDMFRDLTLGALAEEGVDVSAVRVMDGSTGIAHIRVDAASRR
jgi:sugar/nucleoside kinase (ribokinase family)